MVFLFSTVLNSLTLQSVPALIDVCLAISEDNIHQFLLENGVVTRNYFLWFKAASFTLAHFKKHYPFYCCRLTRACDEFLHRSCPSSHRQTQAPYTNVYNTNQPGIPYHEVSSNEVTEQLEPCLNSLAGTAHPMETI